MQKFLGQQYEADGRAAFLKDNCDTVEEKGYMKPFTSEDLTSMKDELAEASIEINDIKEEKKEIVKGYNDKLKPFTEEKHTLLSNIKNKAVYVKELCFKFVDREEKMTGFYNKEGELIESRPSTADEAQSTIFQVNRTGTNN